jgi:hypothetical protein
MKNTLKSLCYFFVLGGLLISCNDNPAEEALVPEKKLVVDEEKISFAFEEMDMDAGYALEEGEGGRVTQPAFNPLRHACATISVNVLERTTTIDFGTEGCKGPDDRVRSGKLVITRSGSVSEGNRAITTTFVNYRVDGIALGGSRTVQLIGENENGHLQQQITLTGGTATFPDGVTMTREATWVRTWVRGANPLQDEFWLEGSASGFNRQGKPYLVAITSPIVRRVACLQDRLPFPVSGEKTMTVTRAGGEDTTMRIDFGNGTCDNQALLTLPNGETRELQLTLNR